MNGSSGDSDGPISQASRGMVLFGTVIILSGAVACEGIMDVASDPHRVDASQPIGLDATMTGAKADLAYAYDTFIEHAGRFGDEFFASSLDQGQINEDARDVDETDSGSSGSRDRTIYSGWWGPQQKATFVANRAQEQILAGEFERVSEPYNDSPEYARVSVYDGFAKTWIADAWCSAAFNNQGPEYSHLEVYGLAEQEFTEAIQAENAEDEIYQAALIGRARVRLILGDEQGALEDAQRVDPNFEFEATYSTNTFSQRNRVWYHTWGFGNLSVDYRRWADLEIDDTGNPDPRIELELDPHAAYDQGQPLWAPYKVGAGNSPLTIASGDEAQYIIAEIAGGEQAVSLINAVRQRHGIETEWVPTGNDTNEIRNKVLDERGRTLFLEGVRLGDLRRYIDKYDIDLFPDVTPQSIPATDVTCFPLPINERENNPGL